MKKLFKKQLAFVLALVIITTLALITPVSAEEIVDLTVKAYGGSTVIVGGTETAVTEDGVDVTTLLTDKRYYGQGAASNYNNKTFDGKHRITNDGQKSRVVKFGYADDELYTSTRTLELSWTDKKAVRRLDLWYGENDNIGNYTIQYLNDNGEWIDHTTGCLDQEVRYNAGSQFGSTYDPILFTPVETNGLRFVFERVKPSWHSDKTTYGPLFTEVRLATDNNYNLLAHEQAKTEIDAIGRWKGALAFRSGVVAAGSWYSNTVTNAGTGADFNGGNDTAQEYGMIWPTDADDSWGDGYSRYVTADSNGDCFYVVNMHSIVDSTEHGLKVNRVKLTLKKGSAKGIEVYTTDSLSKYKALYTTSATARDFAAEGWILQGTYTGDITTSKGAQLDLPEIIESGNVSKDKYRFWLVRVIEPSEDFQLKPVEMYLLDDSELANPPENGALSIPAGGNLTPGKRVDYLYKYTDKVNEEATVIFALYENNALKSVMPASSVTLNGRGYLNTSYRVPEDAAESGLSVRAFLWNTVDGLKPLSAPTDYIR